MLSATAFNPFSRVRHLARYREIATVFARYGFDDLLARTGLHDRLGITRLSGDSAQDVNSPARIRLALEVLGPTFVKLGQLLSTRPDILPPSFIAELAQLQDNVGALPWEELSSRVEAELGADLSTIFEWVDKYPLGSASLAQVHAARLHDGSEVVIKVQRPNIERVIELDLEILYDLAQLLQSQTTLGEFTDLPAVVEEFAMAIQRELDYRREATYAERFRRNFAGDRNVHIPRIYWDYVTHRVLVMERLHGVKIDHVEEIVSMGYHRSEVASRAAGLILREVLEHGFFHADPHPGNFMVMKGGVIGAMDFGQVGTLDRGDRIAMAQLWAGIVNGDAEAICDVLIREGLAEQAIDRDVLKRDISNLLRKYRGLGLQDIRAGELIPEIFGVTYRHHLHLSPDLLLLLKAVMMMEGLGQQLDPDFDVFAASEPYVAKLQAELLQPGTWTPLLTRAAGEWMYLARLAPDLFGQVLRQIQKGQFQIVVRPEGIDPALHRLDLASDRLSISILLASLIVGLALVIPRLGEGSGFLWVQALVILAFTVSVVLGLWLLASMIWKR